MNYLYNGINYNSDYLIHHGIKGQKWGIRRFQNPDGTLTDAGKKRYGEAVLGMEKNDGLIRRALTGDFSGASILKGPGAWRHRDKREERLENKVKLNREAGNKEKEKKYENLLNAQRAKNIDIEKYMSRASTGKLFIQNLLMTPYVADAYRAARARGETTGSAFIESILPRLNLNPLNTESVLAKYRDKKKYGTLAHNEEE